MVAHPEGIVTHRLDFFDIFAELPKVRESIRERGPDTNTETQPIP
jgi:hypothetical protein